MLALLVIFVFGGPSGPRSMISAKDICINQLREIHGAKEQWAEATGMKVDDVIDIRGVAKFLKGKKIPECPTGGMYQLGNVGEEPTCSIVEHRID